MTEAAAIKEAAAINEGMLEALLIIYRIASRALSEEERVGQRIQRNPLGEINGLLVQMMAIEKLAHAGLPKEDRELLDLALAKDETAAIRAEGRNSLISFRGLGDQRDHLTQILSDLEVLSELCAPTRAWARTNTIERPSANPVLWFKSTQLDQQNQSLN